MAKILKADCAGGSAYAVKNAVAFPDHFFTGFKLYIPSATLAAIVAAGAPDYFTADVVFFGDGLFLTSTDGVTWKYWADHDSGGAAGVFTPDVCHTIVAEHEYLGASTWSAIWTIDGVAVLSYTFGAPAGNFAGNDLRVGGYLANGLAGEIYYIADVTVGSTLGGTDIFADDFSSGTFAAWDSETGSVSIVTDTFCSTPPPSAPILIAEPPWRFVMADVIFNGSSPPGFSTLTFLDHRATPRQLRYFLRKAPEASGQVPGDDPEVNIVQGGEPYVEEGVRILIGLRREGGTPPWKPRFAGPILQATRSVQGDAPFVDFTAYGPRQLLYLRPVRQGNGLLLGTQGLTFRQQKGSDILLALINRTETADGPTFIDFTTGTLEDTDPIDINFQQGSSVGEALDQLEATGTIDVLLPTVYDPVGSPGILAQLNIYVQAGSIKRAAIMSWDLPGRNLDEINWLEDGAQRANNVELYTSDGIPTPIQTDGASIAKYGSYWGQQTYPVQTQLAAVEAQAGAQLLISKGHPETLTLGPSPQRAPIPFNDWWLADWLPTYASARLGKKINGLYRVYDFTLNLEDDAMETVRDMLVSANKQPA